MKAGFTYIIMLLDRSGSMVSLREDTIGGFNSFVEEQRKVPGEAVLTLAQFDDKFKICYKALPLAEVPKLTEETFVPRGSTALRDAAARLMISAGQHLSTMKEEDRPENVIFVIITDGKENSSKETPAHILKEMIDLQTNVYKWQFLFLGANMDAALVAQDMGMSGLRYNATGAGIRSTMDTASSYVGSRRTGNQDAAERILKSKDVEDEEAKKASRDFKKTLI